MNRSTNLLTLALVLGVAAAAACTKTADKPEATSLAAVRPDPPSTPAAHPGPVASTASPTAPGVFPNTPIMGRFALEAKNRPDGGLRAEDVYRSFERAGAKVTDERQHLASPFRARYCVGAAVADKVALSVCEFASPEEARAGRDESTRMLVVPNRTVYANRTATLTVREESRTAENDALAALLVKTFAAL